MLWDDAFARIVNQIILSPSCMVCLLQKHLRRLRKGISSLADEDCQYGFDGQPMPGTKALKNKNDRDIVEEWIKSNLDALEKAWDDINNGIHPGMID